MQKVTGQPYEYVTATLVGYGRFRVTGESYPGLIESVDSQVGGVLYSDIDTSSLELLDRFEGQYYQRESVTVMTGQGLHQPADTYIFRHEFTHLLTRELWDVEHFRQRHLNSFLELYQGFS